MAIPPLNSREDPEPKVLSQKKKKKNALQYIFFPQIHWSFGKKKFYKYLWTKVLVKLNNNSDSDLENGPPVMAVLSGGDVWRPRVHRAQGSWFVQEFRNVSYVSLR